MGTSILQTTSASAWSAPPTATSSKRISSPETPTASTSRRPSDETRSGRIRWLGIPPFRAAARGQRCARWISLTFRHPSRPCSIATSASRRSTPPVRSSSRSKRVPQHDGPAFVEPPTCSVAGRMFVGAEHGASDSVQWRWTFGCPCGCRNGDAGQSSQVARARADVPHLPVGD